MARKARTTFTSAAALLACLARAASAQTATTPPAQTSSNESVVVTATIAPIPETALARAVTTLTWRDLDLFGVASAIDALRLAAGVDVDARGPAGVQSDLSIRGATFGQTEVSLDGVRLNDSQSGHHDGDIPVDMLSIDRIEILNGAGSSVHGADALGGAIDVVTRAGRYAAASMSAGQFGSASGDLALSGVGVPRGWLVSGWAQRSSGFTFDREFATGGAALRAQVSPHLLLDVRHQRKAFGADGFYGPSPSKEWTDQTLTTLESTEVRGAWMLSARGTWKNHGDHFRWDITDPGFAENQHRDNAATATLTAERTLADGARLSIGGGAGADEIHSTNLGDHRYASGTAFSELQAPLGTRASAQADLRLDAYSNFGSSWSPSAAVVVRPSHAVRLRASAAHAFRIPTFTELYYHDPANLGTPTLTPEHGWSVDGGMDVDAGGWTLSASPFARWDRNVIDWVRATADDLWRATNVRDVTTHGAEFTATRAWRGLLVRGEVTAQHVDAPALSLLSKYVLSYAKQSIGADLSLPIAHELRLSTTIDQRHRYDGQHYTLLGLRIAREVKRAALWVDGSNLLNRQYQEVTDVAMPGRWITAGVTVR